MSSGAGDGLVWVALALGLAAVVSFGVQLLVQRRDPSNNVASVVGSLLVAATAVVLFVLQRGSG